MEQDGEFDPGVALERALEEAEAAQSRLESVYRSLANGIDPTGVLENSVDAMRTARDAALLVLGRRVLCWIHSGGGLTLEEPETPSSEPDGDDHEADEVASPAALPKTPARPAPAQAAPAPLCPVSLESQKAENAAPVDSPPKGAVPEPSSPPEEVPTEPPPPSPPASLESLRALAEGGLQVRWESAEKARSMPLDRILAGLARPEALSREAARLRFQSLAVINPHTWRGLQAPTQQALLSLLGTWGRDLQERLAGVLEDDFVQYFSRLSEFSRIERPGYVFGLALEHTPQGESWLADAQSAWDQLTADGPQEPRDTPEAALSRLSLNMEGSRDIRLLVVEVLDAGVSPDDPRLMRLLDGRLSALNHEPRLRKVRRALRASSPAPASPDVLPPWSHREQTKGRVAVLLGGDRHDTLRKEMISYFGFQEVRWESGRKMRKVEQIRSSIASGRVDYCFMITRFVSHKATKTIVATCRERGVTLISLGGGKGLAPICAALTERLEQAE